MHAHEVTHFYLGSLGLGRGSVLVQCELHEQAQVAGVDDAAEYKVGLFVLACRRGVGRQTTSQVRVRALQDHGGVKVKTGRGY